MNAFGLRTGCVTSVHCEPRVDTRFDYVHDRMTDPGKRKGPGRNTAVYRADSSALVIAAIECESEL